MKKKIRFYFEKGREGGKAIYFNLIGEKHPFRCKEYGKLLLIGEYVLNENEELTDDFKDWFSRYILSRLLVHPKKKV